MKRIDTLLAVGLICFLAFTGVIRSQDNSAVGSDAFISDFSQKLEFLNRHIALEKWKQLTTGRNDSLDTYRQWYAELTGNPKNPDAVAGLQKTEKDRHTLRQLELLNRLVLFSVVDNTPEIAHHLDSMKRAIGNPTFSFEGNTVDRPSLEEIIASNTNRQRRHEAYLSLYSKSSANAEAIQLLARMRNKEAAVYGYKSYYSMMLAANGLNEDILNSLIEEINDLTAGPYQKTIDSLKRVLNVNKLNVWDIDYAFRRTRSRSAGYFTSDKHLRLAKATYAGMGIKLDALPVYITEPDVGVERSGTSLIGVAVPNDFRIPVTARGNKDGFLEFMTAIGEALYGYNMDKAEYLYQKPPAPVLNSAVYWLVTDIVENDNWNRKYAGMPEPLVLAMRTQNRFLKLYRIRKALAMIAFEQALYKDPFSDLNSKYAAYLDKYLGIGSQPDKSPWADEYDLVRNPAKSANELIGFAIGSQLSAYLEGKYGDILDNQRTREFLVHNIFRFGAREEWQLLIERATGEAVSAKYLISALDD